MSIAGDAFLLASASPRRRELLRLLIAEFDVAACDVDESLLPNEPLLAAASRLARAKADFARQQYPRHRYILAADTLVGVREQVLGKPETRQQAAAMLRQLGGSQHRVVTAICLYNQQQCIQHAEVSDVFFREFDDNDISAYLDLGEYRDKAGSYAIQGYAAAFVRRIEGCYSNIVGLPVAALAELFRQQGIPYWQGVSP